MGNKKVFRLPLIFAIEFRLFYILMVISLFCSVGLIVETIIKHELHLLIGEILILGLEIYCFKIYLIPVVFPLSFGKLIISDQGVEFRCILTKKLFLSWEECKFCGIESYKNDIKDLYGTGRIYIYFSKNELPHKFCGKINKKRNDDDFIKFFPVTVKLCEEILRHKNYSDIRHFLIQKSYKTGD